MRVQPTGGAGTEAAQLEGAGVEALAAPAPRAAELTFDRGTLVLRGADDLAAALPDARLDARVNAVRLPAYRYHHVVRALVGRGLAFEDRAKAYRVLEVSGESPLAPRAYQLEAVEAWRRANRRGVVVLPTGSGKTLVADLAIRDARRSALVVVPTLDLLNQWFALLVERFGEELVGAVGGGEFDVRDLTVITYDSAYLHLERLGDRFGLLILDEVHHLPGPSYVQSARMALAPFRLGLTATPPEDERWPLVADAVGPVVYRQEITDLAGEFLSPYRTETIEVALTDDERAAYDEARAIYRGFVERRNLRLGGPHGWGRFLQETSRSPEGRAALRAWRDQRRIALAATQKLEHLERILLAHPAARVIVFTHTNDLAHEVSRRFLVPVITHQTKPRERRAVLAGLSDGTTPVVVTSRVLNEGVDLPQVGVGVVLSGTGTVREHVQRLGRILRKVDGKEAVLYEVITTGTSEESLSSRRREHDAYR